MVAIESSLIRYLHNGKAEDLHAFRVFMKHYRAWIWIMAKVSNEKGFVIHTTAMKQLFSLAGLIRAQQVHKKQLNSIANNEDTVLKELDVNEKECINIFKGQFFALFNQLLNEHAELLSNVKKIKASAINKQIRKTAVKINAFSTNEADFHEARKLSKRLLYLQLSLPDKLINHTHLNFDFLDVFQDCIGKWHDVHQLIIFTEQIKDSVTFEEGSIKLNKKEILLRKTIRKQAQGFLKNIFLD